MTDQVTEQTREIAPAPPREKTPAADPFVAELRDHLGRLDEEIRKWEECWADSDLLLRRVHQLVSDSHPESAKLIQRAYWLIRRA